MSDVIELHHVSKHYQRGSETIHAVRDVTLSVAAGEFVVIIGPSGSGKTTLLNMIGCVDTPDSGTLRLDGEAINGLTERDLTRIRAQKIGFVFQQFFLLPTLTALENVLLPTVFLHNGDQSQRAAELLEQVHLSGRAKHLPIQLSGGEMQRVAIARALINTPKILLADEPTGNLDSQNTQQIIDLLQRRHRKGLTIIVVTHNEELAHVASKVLRLRDGQFRQNVDGIAR